MTCRAKSIDTCPRGKLENNTRASKFGGRKSGARSHVSVQRNESGATVPAGHRQRGAAAVGCAVPAAIFWSLRTRTQFRIAAAKLCSCCAHVWRTACTQPAATDASPTLLRRGTELCGCGSALHASVGGGGGINARGRDGCGRASRRGACNVCRAPARLYGAGRKAHGHGRVCQEISALGAPGWRSHRRRAVPVYPSQEAAARKTRKCG